MLNVQINGTVFTNNTAATGEPQLHVLASLHANRCMAVSLTKLEAQSPSVKHKAQLRASMAGLPAHKLATGEAFAAATLHDQAAQAVFILFSRKKEHHAPCSVNSLKTLQPCAGGGAVSSLNGGANLQFFDSQCGNNSAATQGGALQV